MTELLTAVVAQKDRPRVLDLRRRIRQAMDAPTTLDWDWPALWR